MPNIHFQCDERKTNEMHFQSKPYIQNINLAPTCFGAAGGPSSGSPKDPYLHLFGTYDVAYTQFHQDLFGLHEDGAPAALKHVGARLIF
jgi:hypothetical protein